MNREPIDLSIIQLFSNITLHSRIFCFFLISDIGDIIEVVPEIVIEFDVISEPLLIVRFFVKRLSNYYEQGSNLIRSDANEPVKSTNEARVMHIVFSSLILFSQHSEGINNNTLINS